MITAEPYGQTFLGQWSAVAARRIDWVSDAIKCALLVQTHVPDRDGDVFLSDVQADETSGPGYTAGGATLSGKSSSYDAAAHAARFFASPTAWVGATFSFRYAVLYKATGVAATSPLIGIVDFGANEVETLATVNIVWDPTNGAFVVAG